MSLVPQPPAGMPPRPPPEAPPLSLPLRLFRISLWFLPSGFLWVTAWLTGFIEHKDLSFWTWVGLNLISLLVASWYHAALSKAVRSATPERQRKTRIVRMVVFFVIQSALMVALTILVVIGLMFTMGAELIKNWMGLGR